MRLSGIIEDCLKILNKTKTKTLAKINATLFKENKLKFSVYDRFC